MDIVLWRVRIKAGKEERARGWRSQAAGRWTRNTPHTWPNAWILTTAYSCVRRWLWGI